MKCEELLAALGDYLDGEQKSALCRQLQEHLSHCSPCQVVIDNLRHTITLYQAGHEVPLPEELHEQICGILRRRWAEKFNQGES
jgi:predicted anti-sigma-YlaC factor YlaD